jgi:hypothetical protein
MHKLSRPTGNRNAFPKELLAFLQTRAAQSMGAQISELAAICDGGARSVYEAIESLTARGWVVGKKSHSNGSPFFFLISGPNGLVYPTKLFHTEVEQFLKPQLAAQPAPRGGEAL